MANPSDDAFLSWLDRVDHLLRDRYDLTLSSVPPGVPLRVRYDAGESPAEMLAEADWLEPPWRPTV